MKKRHRQLSPHPPPARAFGRPPMRTVGLLGGSFNPAHAGHRHVSELALKYLQLDEVWWLVSPQNPLKPAADMAPLASRLASAQRHANHPRMRATAVEAELGTQYTADTLRALLRRFPRTQFVWLMGADNLRQIPRWEAWTSIFHLLPIAVFARPAYDLRALAGKAAIRFKRSRRCLQHAGRLASRTPPVWVFFHSRLHPASGTSIRRGAGARAWTVPGSNGYGTWKKHVR
jgi:nicotinate-nucleotide adenylyltransferase